MKDTFLQGTTSTTDLDPTAIPDCADDQQGELIIGMTSREDLLDMRSERARLLTFGQKWSLQWAEELARFGFYCANPSERNSSGPRCVRCAFCGLEIPHFSSPSDVRDKHTQHARAYCPFLMGSDVGIQISSSERSSTASIVNRAHGNLHVSPRDEVGGGKDFTRSVVNVGGSGEMAKAGDSAGMEMIDDPNGHPATGSSIGCFLHFEAQPARKDNLKHVGATPIFSSHLNAQRSVSVPCSGRMMGQPAFTPPSSVTRDLQQPPRSDPTQLTPLHPPRLHHHQSLPQAQSWSWLSFQHGNQNQETLRPASSASPPPQPSSSTPPPPPHHQPSSSAARANSWPSSSSSAQRRPMTWAYIMRTARYPQMASFQGRLDSLEKTWPLSKPTPRELAKAGLFHVPSSITIDSNADHQHHHPLPSPSATRVTWGDSVKCFWCGERLHQWQASDDAVLEHARLSPGCRYVIQILGRELHDDVIKIASHANDNRFFFTGHQDRLMSSQRSPPPRTTTTSTPTPPTTTHSPQQRPSPSSTQAPPPRHIDVDQAMDSAPVRTVLQVGFSRHLIRELLISHNLAAHELSADYLCELALQATTADPAQLPSWATTPNSSTAETGFRRAIS